MLLRRIELVDFRSYERARVDVGVGVTVLVGPNGHGKTNLLEALHRAATGRSHRVAGDGPLVRLGSAIGIIRVEAETDLGRRRTLDLEVASGHRTRVRVDGQEVRRAADALGVLRVVLFAPEDVALVRGDPSERRRFLDDVLAQRRPAFAAARSDYERVLRQRNQLLKQLRTLDRGARSAAGPTLDTWTDQLVHHGASVVAARLAGVAALAGPVDATYRALADRPERVAVRYRSSAGDSLFENGAAGGGVDRAAVVQQLSDGLAAVADDERRRGVTLVGPHRDDIELEIGRLPARNYASQGEAWSLAVSLRLATYDLLAEVGERPVVLLDDVFAELDDRRRRHLAQACARWDQVLVSAAVEADVPMAGRRLDVRLDAGVTTVHPRPEAAGGVA